MRTLRRGPDKEDVVAVNQPAHHLPGGLPHRVEEQQVRPDQDVLGVLLRDRDLGRVDELEEGGEGVRVEVLQHDLRVL